MNKRVELETLDRTIKDGEIRLRTIQTSIDSLTKEIDILSEVEDQLIDNIKFLKKRKVVAMAEEFKKAKENLTKTVIRLVTLRNDRAQFQKASDEVEKVLGKAKGDMEKLKSDSNVFRGNFGRKNNG